MEMFEILKDSAGHSPLIPEKVALARAQRSCQAAIDHVYNGLVHLEVSILYWPSRLYGPFFGV
jgi:hypothetical protein